MSKKEQAKSNELKEKLKEIHKKKSVDKLIQEYKNKANLKSQKRRQKYAYVDPSKYNLNAKERLFVWDAVELKAKAMFKEGAQAYMDWTAVMNQLIHDLEIFHKAMSYSIGLPIIEALENKSNQFKIQSIAQSNPNIELDLPSLKYMVGFKDNKLCIGELKPSTKDGFKYEGKELPKSDEDDRTKLFNELFQAGVGQWLKENGYKYDSKSEQYLHANSTKENPIPLTKESFEEIKNDKERGLGKWLSGKYDLNFREENEEEQSPSIKP